jgi:hypothetical protein
MHMGNETKLRKVKPTTGFRPAELTPILNLWLEKNRFKDLSDLIRDSLKRHPEIQKLAGKRYAYIIGEFAP